MKIIVVKDAISIKKTLNETKIFIFIYKLRMQIKVSIHLIAFKIYIIGFILILF